MIKTLHQRKHWVNLGTLPGAPDGVYYLDSIKCATDPKTGETWIYVDKHEPTELN